MKLLSNSFKWLGCYIFASRLSIALSFFTVIIFLFSYLITQFAMTNRMWQWLIPSLITLVYLLIIVTYQLFRYGIHHQVKQQYINRAKGKQQLSKTRLVIDETQAYRHYIYHKLRWSRFLPLAVQQLFRRTHFYLAIGQVNHLQKHLSERQWQRLDNPKNYPLTLWTKEKNTLMCLDTNHIAMLLQTLKLLSRFVTLRKMAGVLRVIDIQQKETIDWQGLLYKYSRINNLQHVYLLTGIQQLAGATEAYSSPTIANLLKQAVNHSEFQQQLDDLSQQYMQNNNDTIENAQLQLFVLQLKQSLSSIQAKISSSESVYLLSNDKQQSLTVIWQQLQQLRQQQFSYHKKRFAYYGIPSLCVLLLICFIISYQGNSERLEKSQQSLLHYQQMLLTNDKKKFIQQAENDITAYQSFQPNTDSWLLHMGLYQGNALRKILSPVYQTNVQSIFLPLLQQQLRNLLQIAISKNKHIDEALASYLMLSEPEHFNAKQLFTWLQSQQQNLSDKSIVTQTMQQVLEQIQQESFRALSSNKILIDKARQQLPALTQQFTRALQQWQHDSTAYNLLQQLSTSSQSWFKQPMTISQLYTKSSYQKMLDVNSPIRQWLQQQWIYQTNSQQIIEQLIAIYQQYYLQAWQKLVDQFSLLKLNNMEKAKQLAEQASDSSAFWQQLITIVVDNTHLSTDDPVSDYFANWYQLQHNQQAQKLLTNITMQFGKMQAPLDTLIKDKTPAKSAFDLITSNQITGIPSFNQLDNLLTSNLPSPLKTWLIDIRQQLAQSILSTAKIYINQQWQQQVLPKIEDKWQKYPLAIQADEELSLQEFTQLFNQQSDLVKFLQNSIAPFLRLDSAKLRYYYGASLPLNHDEQQLFQQLSTIANYLLTDGKLSIHWSARPDYLSNQIARVEWQGLSSTWQYQHGPLRQQQFVWPNQSTQVSLRWYYANGKYNAQTIQGDWAWLHLLQQAKIKKVGKNWQLRFYNNHYEFRLFIYASPAMNILLSGMLSNIYLPSSLSGVNP